MLLALVLLGLVLDILYLRLSLFSTQVSTVRIVYRVLEMYSRDGRSKQEGTSTHCLSRTVLLAAGCAVQGFGFEHATLLVHDRPVR